MYGQPESLDSTRHTTLEGASFATAMVLLVCSVAFSIQFALQHDVRVLLLRVVDDAAYYMNTARNIAEGHGMTFDGIHRTNGFHPLWLLMLVPLFLLHASPETMIRLVLVLQAALLTIAFLVLYRTQAKMFSHRAALISGICFVSLVFMQSLNGMESALFVLLLVILYAYGFHLSRVPLTFGRSLLFGALVGLMLLSRLDMIFVPIAVLGCSIEYVLSEKTHPRAFATILTAWLAAALVVVPYLLFNLEYFGSAMPISGALKSSFPSVALSQDTLAGIDNRHYAMVAFAVAWLIARIVRSGGLLPKPGDNYYTVSTTVLAWAVVLHFLDTVLFMQWGVFAWHFILYPLFAVVAFAGIVDSMLKWRPVAHWPAVFWVVAGIMVAAAARKEHTRDVVPLDHLWHVASYNAAVWAREHTAPDSIFAMRDTGHFAFFSGRRAINLDGLVNNMDYQRVIAQRRVREYLRDNHVEYLVLHSLPGHDDVFRGAYDSVALNYVSHKYNVVSDDVVVHHRDEVYRSSPYFDGPNASVCLIWSLLGKGTGSPATTASVTVPRG